MLNVIVDLSHHNHKPDLQAAADAGILGVIHKATQGTGFVDPTLIENCAKAKAAQLFWGAYHFGVAGDGAAQANRFLEVVQPEKDTLLALDFEQNHVDDSMTLDQARAFIARVRETTGQFPGLYGGATCGSSSPGGRTTSLRAAGSGSPSTAQRRTFRRTGRSGRCGSTRTAPTGTSRTASPGSADAIAISSTATSMN